MIVDFLLMFAVGSLLGAFLAPFLAASWVPMLLDREVRELFSSPFDFTPYNYLMAFVFTGMIHFGLLWSVLGIFGHTQNMFALVMEISLAAPSFVSALGIFLKRRLDFEHSLLLGPKVFLGCMYYALFTSVPFMLASIILFL